MEEYENLTREELIRQLELVKAEKAFIFSNAERISTKQMLANMISIRKILSDILKLLLTAGDQKIDQALLLLLPFFKVDRAYIGEDKAGAFDFTHEVTEHGIASFREELLVELPESEVPWWTKTLKNGKNIVIDDVAGMPAEAYKEQRLLELQNIRSLLAIPLFRNGKTYGFIGLDSVREYKQWTAVDMENLRMLADIISVALERSKALKEKENSENRFRVLYENMPLGYLYKKVVFDENGKPVDMEYLDANPMIEKIFGIRTKDCIGNTFKNLFGQYLSHDIWESQLTVARSHTPLIVERIEMFKDKLVKITSYSPFPDHLVTLCTEFSTQTQLKETLLRSETKFKLIFEKLPWGVELYDCNGFLLDINNADLQIFGTTREGAMGINMFDNPNIPDFVNEKLKKGEDVSFRIDYDFKKVNRSKYYPTKLDEHVKHLLVKGVPLKNNDNIFGYLYIVFDDTENFRKNEQTQHNLARVRVAMDTGESLIWEYDTVADSLTIDFDANRYHDSNIVSFLKACPITDRAAFVATLHPDDKEEVYDRHFLPLLKGEIDNYSIMYRRVTGNRSIWLMSNVRGYRYNPDGTPNKIVCYVTDITDKVQLQDKLRQVENENKMFGYAVSQSNNEIFAIDTDSRIVFCNQRVADNYKFRKPVTNYRLHDINPDFTAEQWVDLRKELRRKQSITFETIHRLVSGEKRPVEVHVYRVDDQQWGELFWCFVRDITQRVRQRHKISWLNSLMETILNNVPVAIAVKNVGENLKHIYFNNAAENFTGKQAHEVLGKTDFEIFADEKTAQDIRSKDLLAVKNGTYTEYAVECNTPHGEQRIINSVRLSVNFPNNDNHPMIIVLIWDITDQRKNEIELVKAKEADKLKSAFLANMSHEIRTPLNAIVGFSSIMAEADDPEERHTYQEIINKNNDLLLQLIDDILDFSKIEAGMMDFHKSDTDIKEICQEIYQVHSLRMKENVQLLFDEKHLPTVIVNTDMKRVIQVLSNFVTNAVKFTQEGSITIDYRLRGNDLYVSVADTGTGIPEEYLPIIFDRFIKVNDFKQGTGLGLPISKMIIENLGGEIGVNSEEGKGSTFWFTLPVKTEEKRPDAARPPEEASADLPEPRKKTDDRTILIAEDVEENYRLLQALLKKNYRLIHARNGREAVELHRLHRPDLILMDMKMPVMDGFEASCEIRKNSRKVPIVALSAFAFESEKQKALSCGVTDYLVKPVDIHALRRLLIRLLPSE